MSIFSALDSIFAQGWLIFLLALWSLLLFGGFLFGSSPAEGRRMPRWARLASSAVLVVAGWSWTVFAAGNQAQPYALLIALGMTLGFLGDCFIAGALPAGGKIGGVLSFALGHLAYIAGILWFSRQLAPLDFGLLMGARLFWWVLALLGWYVVVYRPAMAETRLHWLVLPYGLLLATTAAVATTLALQVPDFWPLVLGAALFLLSDTILGGAWFSELHLARLNVHDLIWLTYGPGQMLIVYSIGIALVQTSLPA